MRSKEGRKVDTGRGFKDSKSFMMKFVAWQQDDSDVKVKSFREAVIFRLHYSSPLAFVVANNKHFLLGLFSLSLSLHNKKSASRGRGIATAERVAVNFSIHNSQRWHNTNVSL